MSLKKLTSLLFLLTAGCAITLHSKYDAVWGPENASRRALAARTLSAAEREANLYHKEIKPIFDARCAVCHGCYDAPCQLKLTSYEGLERGASAELVYDGARLIANSPTRLFVDGQTPSDWRAKGFYPVLNERSLSSEANLKGSVLARLLRLKREFPLTTENKPLDGFDFSLNREQVCPTIDQIDTYEKEHPRWGMPFGLPGLTEQEYKKIDEWIAKGAKYAANVDLPHSVKSEVRRWESFFNGDSKKEQLVNRYLYEHLYLAHLYFSSTRKRLFFELVRSRTPPGEPVERIPSVRPYGEPNVERVYYRLLPIHSSIVLKRHMPYALNEKRMRRYKELFYAKEYEVNTLPSYKIEEASNPFLTFRQLPAISRYKFLLDEAQFSIMNFIKGPVCRGQIALNVIRDHFWVFFLNPDLAFLEEAYEGLGQSKEGTQLILPAEAGSNTFNLSNWLKYAENEKARLKQSAAYIDKALYANHLVNLNLIWDGNRENPNAGLTIFRHFDNASVVKGLVGSHPKTVWIIDYSLLERIHYLLVAGFDVYGNLGHQLHTRLYMDFLRMEGEARFLGLLPPESRKQVRDEWYKDAKDHVKDFVYGEYTPEGREVNIHFSSKNPKRELLRMLQKRLSSALDNRYELTHVQNKEVRNALQKLSLIKGPSVSLLPQLAFLKVPSVGVFSLINNSAHKNIAHLFGEESERDKENDTLTVANGFIGAHPNVFFHVKSSDVLDFVAAVYSLSDETSYSQLVKRFGVRRNNPEFWKISDSIHADARRFDGISSGLFDYNRYENR